MKSRIKNIASQSFRVIICLVVLFMFVFVTPKQYPDRVHAALPLVAWVAPVLGDVVVDTALDMGVGFVDEKSKNAWKDKQVGQLWNKYGDAIKDLKPTKKNLKEWALDVPKWLMVAIIDSIADDSQEVIEQYNERKSSSEKYSFPERNIEFEIIGQDAKAYDYWKEYGKFSFVDYDGGTAARLDVGSDYLQISLQGGSLYQIKLMSYYNSLPNLGVDVVFYVDGGWVRDYPKRFTTMIPQYEKKLKVELDSGKKIYQHEGTLVTNNNYFDLPDVDIDGNEIIYSPAVLEEIDSAKYPVANSKKFDFDLGDGVVIDADFQEINEGDSFEWEIVEKDISNNPSNYNKVIEYDYNPVVNNSYEVSDKEGLKQDIDIIIKNDIDVGGGGNGGNWSGEITIEGPYYCVDKSSKLPTSCKSVEAIDGSLLDYVSNAYDYAVNAVKSGVDGLNTIVSGSAGLIALYGHIFSWLPSEVTVILTSGLLLMVGLRVFRK